MVLAAALLASAAACGSDSKPSSGSASDPDTGPYAALYANAKKESGTLVIYTNQQAVTGADLGAEFAAMFPDAPKVQVVTYAGADAATRYGAERQSGSCASGGYLGDIKSASAFWDKGWLLEQTDRSVPIRAKYDGQFKAPGYTVAGIVSQGIIYNTNNVKTAPTDLKDLLNPVNKGRIGLGDPRAQLPDLAAMNVIYQKLGLQGLKDLAALEPKYFNSAVPGTAAVASGEINFYYPTYNILFQSTKTSGAPVGMITPDGLSAAVPVMSISKGAGCNLTATATLFADFLLSAPGQAILNGPSGNGSGLPEAAEFKGLKTYPSPAKGTSVTIGTPETLERLRAEILTGLGLK